MKRLSIVAAALLIVIGALADRVILGAGSQPTATPAVVSAAGSSQAVSSVSANSIDQATISAYNTARKSIVYIDNKGVGTGSGIIYDTRGDIVTNHHVVSGGSGLSVTLSNGKTYSATLVGSDAADDLAVIRIHASGLTPAHFAAAGQYQVGQTVLAIGSPLGLQESVTSGLISGVHRVEQEPNGSYLSDALQTSAPINPGNSGGALVTLGDLVVGMPTLEQTSSATGSSTQDIGFAIPSERIVYIANQIIKTGSVQHTGRPYLGVAPTDASGGTSGFGFGQSAPTTSGAIVARVSSNGPAGKAGVQQGDVITGIDGTQVTDTSDLLTYLATEKPGNSVTLRINRNGQMLTVHVTLGELPASG
jgi:S1-C subfamily serine protease